MYLGEVEEDLDGVGDDVHAGDAPVAAADESEDDVGGSALYQPLAALRGQPGGGLCACTHVTTHTKGLLLALRTNFSTEQAEDTCDHAHIILTKDTQQPYFVASTLDFRLHALDSGNTH